MANHWQRGKDFFNACIADPIGNSVYQTRNAISISSPFSANAAWARDLKKTIGLALPAERFFHSLYSRMTRCRTCPPLTLLPAGWSLSSTECSATRSTSRPRPLDPIGRCRPSLCGSPRKNLEVTNTPWNAFTALLMAMPESRAIFQEAAPGFFRVAAYQQAACRLFEAKAKSTVIRPFSLGQVRSTHAESSIRLDSTGCSSLSSKDLRETPA